MHFTDFYICVAVSLINFDPYLKKGSSQIARVNLSTRANCPRYLEWLWSCGFPVWPCMHHSVVSQLGDYVVRNLTNELNETLINNIINKLTSASSLELLSKAVDTLSLCSTLPLVPMKHTL